MTNESAVPFSVEGDRFLRASDFDEGMAVQIIEPVAKTVDEKYGKYEYKFLTKEGEEKVFTNSSVTLLRAFKNFKVGDWVFIQSSGEGFERRYSVEAHK